jgi:hypothetical protein
LQFIRKSICLKGFLSLQFFFICYNQAMFFSPIEMYLKALLVTLVVEVVLFVILISKKPLKITAAVLFNLSSNLLLHVYFHYCVVWGFSSMITIWIIGEIFVIVFESLLFNYSKIITPIKRATLFSILFNGCSIVIGRLISLVFF